jgi:hypothetical protein
MARRLIVIARPARRVVGATPIGPDYPRSYSASKMRRWAADLERLAAMSADELARLQALAPEDLTLEQRGVVDAHAAYFLDPSRGIKGDLRDDGVIELSGGRHRAAYIAERGEPMPVWVSCPDEHRLDDYAARCERELELERTRDRTERSGGGDRVRA